MPCEEKQSRVQDKVKALVDELSAESQQIAQDVQREAGEIDPDIDTSGPDVWIGIDVDIKWESTDFSLDLPEVTMRDQTWALDLPQVTMANTDIIFHLPTIRMVRKKTGEYPETTCGWKTTDGPFGTKFKTWQCTVKWSPLYMDIPETYMEEKRIVIGVPEFRMDRTEMVLAIPEFSMRRHDFSLKLPRITVKNISVEAKEAEKKGEALSAKAKARTEELQASFAETAKAALGPDVTDLFYCYESDMAERRNEGVAKFNEAVAVFEGVIAALANNKVPDDNETMVSMRSRLKEAIAARDQFATEIEQKFRELHAEQENFFKNLLGGARDGEEQPAEAEAEAEANLAAVG